MSGGVIAGKPQRNINRGFVFRTLLLMAVCGVAVFVVLAVRLYDIQITSNDHFERLALQNQLRHSTLMASRGTIFDTNGKILAMSASAENIFISPFDIERFDEDANLIAEGLSLILNVPLEQILEVTERAASQYQLIKRNADNAEVESVREFITEHGLRSIHFESSSKRVYPNDILASQIIGFVGTENNGLEGLERQFDRHLTAISGREVRITNARGAGLHFAEYEDYLAAQNGNNITLTIDAQIQFYVEKHLERAILDYDVQGGGVCIAMRPRTGEILAIANYPYYDPNDFLTLSEREMERLSLIEDEEEYEKSFREAQYRQWRNRALADTYEPGSVFKLFTMAIALEENIISTDSHFFCQGSIEVLGRINIDGDPVPIRCWSRYGHGSQNLDQIMENSCNISFVNLGLGLGARTFYDYVRAFGLFERTGLNNSAESRSIWWSESVFFDRNNYSQLASASFGQTFKVNPMQITRRRAATINGGNLMQPYMVKHITDSEGNIIEANEPTVLRSVISAETSAVMRSQLENVVVNGTGRNAQVRGYRIGGKTGTSENIEQLAGAGEDEIKNYIVSFVGFAPADDPEIIILLLLDTPSHNTGITISGGAMAAPVVGNILADILPMSLGVRPQYTEEDLKHINLQVPRLLSRNVEDAKEILANQGFKVSVIGDGESVTAQFPHPSLFVSSGTTVVLYAGEDAPRETVIVPQLFKTSYSAAKQKLESSGMFIRTMGALKTDSNTEISVQSIAEGMEVPYGTVIEVTLINRDAVAPH